MPSDFLSRTLVTFWVWTILVHKQCGNFLANPSSMGSEPWKKRQPSPPAVPFYPFLREGSPLKSSTEEKGTNLFYPLKSGGPRFLYRVWIVTQAFPFFWEGVPVHQPNKCADSFFSPWKSTGHLREVTFFFVGTIFWPMLDHFWTILVVN